MNLRSLKEIFRYPTAVAGFVIILLLIGVSIYTMIAIPYNQAVLLWRGNESDWYTNPKTAAPVWFNWFRKEKLPETLVLTTGDEAVTSTVKETKDGRITTYTFPIDFEFDSFYDDISIFFTSSYDAKAPFVGLKWIAPDGKETRLGNFSIGRKYSYRMGQDKKLTTKLKGNPAEIGLFTDLKDVKTPIKGQYTLEMEVVSFDKNTEVKAEYVMYGKLAGWAGTDHRRRDLSLALLWGTPIALTFGLLAAVGTSLSQLIIAGVSTWFGGIVDTIIQRVTEINLVIPFLPVLIMIGTFYSRSIFVILGAVILLSIFGSGIKTYRAVFLQVKESTYIEAAKTYGASNARIIFMYMIPRLIPMLIPAFVVQIPAYVFLEASLAVLGLGDPTLPTWGKIIDESRNNQALFQGWYYWVLEPSALLMITGLAFTVVGYALDRVFNPRLRGQ
ncbi:MAG TPA: ABC transporter permease [Anaerolineaceae bacterium]